MMRLLSTTPPMLVSAGFHLRGPGLHGDLFTHRAHFQRDVESRDGTDLQNNA